MAKELLDPLASGFVAMLDAAPDAMLLVSDDGSIVAVNREATRAFGYERDELVGMSVGALLPEHPTGIVLSALRRDGSEFPVEVSLSRVPHGEHMLTMTAVRDVTALRKAEAKFRGLLEAAPDANVIVDTDGKIQLVNAQAERMFGYPRDELVGRCVDMLVPQRLRHDHRHHRAHFAAAPRARAIGSDLELHAVRKDGSEFPVEISLSQLETEDGSLIFTAIRDVGARKRTERALRDAYSKLEAFSNSIVREGRESEQRAVHALEQSEARFARLSESGIVGIATADLDGKVVDANDAYLRLVGRSRADLATLRWDDVNPPQWEWRNALTAEQMQSTGVAGPWEQEILHRDGTRVPVLIGVATLGTDQCISFIADLTDRKRTEAALVKSESQLRQSQKMEAIGSLAGGIAHDFNNLLTVILSYSALALEVLPESNGLRADLVEVYRAGERASELTRQLLAFSRRQVLQPRLHDLNEVISGMAKMLRRLLGEHIELVIALPETLPRVRVDRGQLEQVVMNLVVNARDAMPTGGILCIGLTDVVLGDGWVADHVGGTPGRHVRLEVKDDGCGMDPETLGRSFEPFFTTKPTLGTGLGLSTVLGIVQQSGGTIWVHSELGVGTTFEIYLPVASAQLADERPVDPVPSEDRGGTETILLVEDDLQVRTLAHTILRRHGYKVLEAQSGGDALLLSEQHTGGIALLLTDVVMPRLSGRELAERLRPARPDLRTLYMSGYTNDEVVRHGVFEADVPFVQKPFTPQSLARAVRGTLDAPLRARP